MLGCRGAARGPDPEIWAFNSFKWCDLFALFKQALNLISRSTTLFPFRLISNGRLLTPSPNEKYLNFNLLRGHGGSWGLKTPQRGFAETLFFVMSVERNARRRIEWARRRTIYFSWNGLNKSVLDQLNRLTICFFLLFPLLTRIIRIPLTPSKPPSPQTLVQPRFC